mgnify:CR=1 FL=1
MYELELPEINDKRTIIIIKKKLKVNNTNIVKVSDYISNLNVIIFTPDDLEIIKGSPSVRRNLLNIQLSQISKQYISVYNEYNNRCDQLAVQAIQTI